MPMILFHTENLPHYGLERIFEIAKKAGFDGLEIAINDIYDTQSPAYIKQLEKRYALPVKAFTITKGREELVKEAFQKTVREFPKATINLVPPKTFGFEYKKWMNDIVPRLAQKYDLQYCRRNAPSETVMGIIPKHESNSLMALKEKGSVCLDLSALAMGGQEIMRSIALVGDRLKHVYLSNYYRDTPYALLEKGVLPLESFLTKLAQVGYKGDFTLRISPRSLGEGEDERLLETMKKSLEFVKTYFVAK